MSLWYKQEVTQAYKCIIFAFVLLVQSKSRGELHNHHESELNILKKYFKHFSWSQFVNGHRMFVKHPVSVPGVLPVSRLVYTELKGDNT